MTQSKSNPFSTLLLISASPVTNAFFQEMTSQIDELTFLSVDSEEDALDFIQKILINIIIIDETTPNIDLAKICTIIRNLNDYEYTPILVITSHLKKSFIRRLLKAGVTDFLREPLEENECLHRMEMAREMKKTEQKMSMFPSRFPMTKFKHMSMEERIVLDDRATKLISIALEEKTSLVLLLIEIDQYKEFLKEKGRKATLHLLEQFRFYLQTLMRGQDLLFPQKRGKFLALFPRTSSKAAQFIAENIQDSLNIERFQVENTQVALTISVGLVALDEINLIEKSASFNFDRLLQIADSRLRKAKKSGNTIVALSQKKDLP